MAEKGARIFLIVFLSLLSVTGHREKIKPARHARRIVRRVESNAEILVRRKLGAKTPRLLEYFKRYSKKYDVPFNAVVATAYVESEFSMNSGPCIGIMQVQRGAKGLNPYKLRDNIELGCAELGRDLKRGRSLTNMWGRYNGCGSHGAYVRRVRRVWDRLKFMSRKKFNSLEGDIWK